MASKQKILVVGGGGKTLPSGGPGLPEAVKAKITSPEDLTKLLKAMMDEASDKGYEVHMMQLADEDKSFEWVEEVRAMLASGPWDGFIIGNGIRSTPNMTLCFERLVATGREVAPNTPMGFNTHPMDVLETMERVCGGR